MSKVVVLVIYDIKKKNAIIILVGSKPSPEKKRLGYRRRKILLKVVIYSLRIKDGLSTRVTKYLASTRKFWCQNPKLYGL